MDADGQRTERTWRRTLALAVIGLGLSLTLNGYVSRDGDQAYRLPLLLHRQNPSLFQNDPFVQALDEFNPHTHYLQLLDAASRPFGLSAGLFLLYAATFLLTFIAVDFLARRVWPEVAAWIGVVAAALVFTAKAGNIGTNHLFEPLLLDRMIALAFGWSALALALSGARRLSALSAISIGLAAWVHPSMGLQMGLWLAACWVLWAAVERRAILLWQIAWLGITLVPGLIGMDSSRLFEGLSAEQFRLLTAYVQSPQHMIPRLWRTSQWCAAFCFPALAGFAVFSFRRLRQSGFATSSDRVRQETGTGSESSRCLSPFPAEDSREEMGTANARQRLLIALGLIVVGLIAAAGAIEWVGDLRVTLIQPFRMATVGRGICLILLAPHVLMLVRQDQFLAQCRAAWLFVGLIGDWTLVVVTCIEAAFLGAGWLETSRCRRLGPFGVSAVIAGGLLSLAWHDTESGHVRLLAATVGVLAARAVLGRRSVALTKPRLVRIAGYCWLVPLAALLCPTIAPEPPALVRPLTKFLNARCRFGETPLRDIERLALWCRDHTRPDAVFIGPPGPKTFRLWSNRALAFNRAGSPYHAAGIADWAERFRAHVGFDGTLDAFAEAYLTDHQALERRYDDFTAGELADLARRQKAEYVITETMIPPSAFGPLERLHAEGRFTVYRVRVVVAARSAGTG